MHRYTLLRVVAVAAVVAFVDVLVVLVPILVSALLC